MIFTRCCFSRKSKEPLIHGHSRWLCPRCAKYSLTNAKGCRDEPITQMASLLPAHRPPRFAFASPSADRERHAALIPLRCEFDMYRLPRCQACGRGAGIRGSLIHGGPPGSTVACITLHNVGVHALHLLLHVSGQLLPHRRLSNPRGVTRIPS